MAKAPLINHPRIPGALIHWFLHPNRRWIPLILLQAPGAEPERALPGGIPVPFPLRPGTEFPALRWRSCGFHPNPAWIRGEFPPFLLRRRLQADSAIPARNAGGIPGKWAALSPSSGKSRRSWVGAFGTGIRVELGIPVWGRAGKAPDAFFVGRKEVSALRGIVGNSAGRKIRIGGWGCRILKWNPGLFRNGIPNYSLGKQEIPNIFPRNQSTPKLHEAEPRSFLVKIPKKKEWKLLCWFLVAGIWDQGFGMRDLWIWNEGFGDLGWRIWRCGKLWSRIWEFGRDLDRISPMVSS